MARKILVIEDNETILKGIIYLLKQEKFDVTSCKNCADFNMNGKFDYDLAILDVMLPDGNGYDLCKYIKQKSNVPIIFLTAKDEERDIVHGFDIGADDYIVKPFRARELISRINNILRRTRPDFNILKYDKIEINLDATTVKVNNEEVAFTPLEYKILILLYSNFGKTVTREAILEKIWDLAGNFVNDNTLTVYIKRIRAKLGRYDNIQTVKGIGYKVE